MKFYSIQYLKDITKECIFPCLAFKKDNWNDYGYRTLFIVYHFLNSSNYEELGYYRIMHIEEQSTELDAEFEKLNEDYCSLAMSEDFYKKFHKRDPNNIQSFLLFQQIFA